MKVKNDILKIKEFITKTGFIFEMEISEFLKKQEYTVKVNKYFLDYETNKKREIDIIASKTINNVNIILIIECKQSLFDDWIFICSDNKPPRYYVFQKHLPLIKTAKIKESKIFNHLHTISSKIPLAQNYIIKNAADKKSDLKPIDDCIEKLPKIIVDIAHSSNSNGIRQLFIPIAVFSGKIFTANYKDKLLIKKEEIIQYQKNLESEQYTYHPNRTNYIPTLLALEPIKKEEGIKNSVVASISRDLHSYYVIDFVTKKGLKKLIKTIEKETTQIDTKLWEIEKLENPKLKITTN